MGQCWPLCETVNVWIFSVIIYRTLVHLLLLAVTFAPMPTHTPVLSFPQWPQPVFTLALCLKCFASVRVLARCFTVFLLPVPVATYMPDLSIQKCHSTSLLLCICVWVNPSWIAAIVTVTLDCWKDITTQAWEHLVKPFSVSLQMIAFSFYSDFTASQLFWDQSCTMNSHSSHSLCLVCV